MGDRYYYYSDCPKCGAKQGLETYDAPSCYQYVVSCEVCGWVDRNSPNYYDIADNEIVLCTKEEYIKKYKYTPFCQERRKEIAEWLKEDRKK